MTQVATASQAQTAPLSIRAVNKAAGLLAGKGSSRRRFLYRLAVIGSAMSLDPVRYVLRPTPAYASVCGSGNTCGSGWSVFCCTINGGANTCPSGSFVAGWWKVDNSAFCLGAPRYYIDCNRRPGSSCRCRCNSTGCDRRRVCCNVFRYGQCNTHIRGVTEVVCRLITCTPPWQWASCSRTVRVSNATRSHSSRCLPGPNPTRIAIKYQDMGLVGSPLRKPTSREVAAANNGRKRHYERGMILWHPRTGAHALLGPFARRYRKMGADKSTLGYPRTDQRWVKGRTGWFVRFQRGSMYRRRGEPVRSVLGRTDGRYRALGGPAGTMGYPLSSTSRSNAPGMETRFERGDIFMSPRTTAVEVRSHILTLFRARGGPGGSGLGFPKARARRLDDGGIWQDFERGAIVGARPRRVFAVHGAIFARYRQVGGTTAWGYPRGHTTGVAGGLESRFQRAGAFWSATTGARWTKGPVLRRYDNEGGPAGRLGFPTGDLETLPDGKKQQTTFQNGVIVYDPDTGHTTVTLNP